MLKIVGGANGSSVSHALVVTSDPDDQDDPLLVAFEHTFEPTTEVPRVYQMHT